MRGSVPRILPVLEVFWPLSINSTLTLRVLAEHSEALSKLGELEHEVYSGSIICELCDNLWMKANRW